MHFGTVSLAALPANLLAAAAIAPVMWLGMLAAAAAQVAPALAEPFNALNAPLLRFVEWVAHTMAGAPAAVMPLRDRARRRRSRPRTRCWPPPRWRCARCCAACPSRSRRRRGPRLGLAAALTAAGAAAVLLATASRGPRGATGARRRRRGLVPEHRAGRRDADPERARERARRHRAARTARSSSAFARPASSGSTGWCSRTRRPTTRAMALEVMRAFPTRLVVDGGAGWSSYMQRGLPGAVAADHARLLPAHAGQVLTFGAITMRLLWPPPPGPGFRAQGDPNDRAIVALVARRRFRPVPVRGRGVERHRHACRCRTSRR